MGILFREFSVSHVVLPSILNSRIFSFESSILNPRFSDTVNIRNKKARFTFELTETFIAGIALHGTEIKSIKEGKASLQEAYCYFSNNELYVKSMNISPYAQGGAYNHEAVRDRKLLLKKAELRKLKTRAEEKNLTIVPLRLFINERGYAKLEIALARGKKVHDKRETIKERDLAREMAKIKVR